MRADTHELNDVSGKCIEVVSILLDALRLRTTASSLQAETQLARKQMQHDYLLQKILLADKQATRGWHVQVVSERLLFGNFPSLLPVHLCFFLG